MSVFAVDRGTPKEIQQISTLPPDFTGRNSTAEIQIDKAGQFLYVSNRGANSIAVYAVDPGKGKLTASRARSRPWSIATQHHDRSNRPILLRRQPAFKQRSDFHCGPAERAPHRHWPAITHGPARFSVPGQVCKYQRNRTTPMKLRGGSRAMRSRTHVIRVIVGVLGSGIGRHTSGSRPRRETFRPRGLDLRPNREHRWAANDRSRSSSCDRHDLGQGDRVQWHR